MWQGLWQTWCMFQITLVYLLVKAMVFDISCLYIVSVGPYFSHHLCYIKSDYYGSLAEQCKQFILIINVSRVVVEKLTINFCQLSDRGFDGIETLKLQLTVLDQTPSSKMFRGLFTMFQWSKGPIRLKWETSIIFSTRLTKHYALYNNKNKNYMFCYCSSLSTNANV